LVLRFILISLITSSCATSRKRFNSFEISYILRATNVICETILIAILLVYPKSIKDRGRGTNPSRVFLVRFVLVKSASIITKRAIPVPRIARVVIILNYFWTFLVYWP
jgi:hypothetical protein